MPTIDVNGTTLSYDDTGGDGPAVVLSHALFFDRGMFAAQVARFGRAYRVVGYDHRGQGESRRSAGLDMDTLAEDAAALVEALDLGPCHFVGHGMGGFVALRLVARRPELLRSAAVLGSSADEESAPLHEVRFDALPRLVFGDSTLTGRAAVQARWARHFAELDDAVLAAAEGVVRRKAVLGELIGAGVPLLVLSGAEDRLYGREPAERIADTAANAAHVVVTRAGHALAVERPDAVNDVLAEHFAAA